MEHFSGYENSRVSSIDPSEGERNMRLSTRNQLAGKVESVSLGGIMASVKVRLGSDEVITAAITREAAEELNLSAGTEVVVLVKSTEVMLGIE
jgi:molybdate transport system regulatory protein